MTSSDRSGRRHVTRRRLLQGAGALAAGASLTGGYAFGIEPFRERVTRYAITPQGWPAGMRLRIAVIADLHICEPWTGVRRLERIVEETNALQADVIVLLGDYVPGQRIEQLGRPIAPTVWGPILGRLRAPGGVHGVLGNHDWWEDDEAQRAMKGPTLAHRTLADNGIVVHENTAARMSLRDSRGQHWPYWIAGLGDQWAFFTRRRAVAERGRRRYRGVDDLAATLRAMTDDAPAILLIHEPDIFPSLPDRFSLTLAGHTHGGQVRLLGYSPIVPSRYKNRYAYGHVLEDGRHLIVSAGLGVSGIPVRFGITPEIVLAEIG